MYHGGFTKHIDFLNGYITAWLRTFLRIDVLSLIPLKLQRFNMGRSISEGCGLLKYMRDHYAQFRNLPENSIVRK